MSGFTRILSEIEQGDPNAAEQPSRLVYDELRKLATARLANEKYGQTLQATALVHDACICLVDVDKAEERRIGQRSADRKVSMKRYPVDYE